MIRFREILESINEDAERDKYYRDKARNIYNQMIDYLNDGGDITVGPSTNPEYFSIRLDLTDFYDIDWELKDYYNPLAINFFDRKKDPGTHGKYDAKNVAPVLKMYILFADFLLQKHDIPLNVKSDVGKYYDEMNTEDFKDSARKHIVKQFQNSSKYREVFIHEMTHHFDFRRSQLSGVDWGQSDTDYFKQDIEINAYFQGKLADFEEELETNPEKYESEVEDWKDSFRDFKEWFFDDKTMKRFERIISDDQYKRIVNRLYGFWDKYLSEFDINNEG